MTLEIVPVEPELWPAVQRLLGSGRKSRSCWCQWFRLRPAEYDAASVEERMGRLLDRVASGPPPGLLALESGEPVGWLSFGPIQEFEPRLSRWSVAKSASEALPARAWVVNCLFVPEGRRHEGVGSALIGAAVRRARDAGAASVVAFPFPAGRSPSEGASGVGHAAQFLANAFELEPGPLEGRPWAVLRLEA
jgi:GNAT superfamily N-acetyltransferase